MRRSRPKKKKIKRVSVVHVVSKTTGLHHQFVDTKQWEKIASKLSKAYERVNFKDLIRTLPFWTMLHENKETFLIQPRPSTTTLFYRSCNPKYDPLSCAGSLADGGRFNIGGAQQIDGFNPKISKVPCLYLASTLKTAQAETPAELKKTMFYQVAAKRALSIWDLDEVITFFESKNSGLRHSIEAVPMSAAWGLQKTPLISQLLAHFLRSIGGDGLRYRSTKDPLGSNFAFFVSSDVDAHSKFTSEEVK